jgi:RNA polymerase sigma factor (sigma-70 family)
MGRSTPFPARIFQKTLGFFSGPVSGRNRLVPPLERVPAKHHPGTSLLTRPTLLYRVRDTADRASWDEFHRLYRRLIYGRARRAGLPHADAEEVAQDVFKRVAETIHDFDLNPDRGSFRGWLMKLTHWRIADKFEGRAKIPTHTPSPAPADATGPRTATIERVPAPVDDEDEWDREWREHVLAAAVERLSRRVKPRHFQVFELYVRQSWPVLKVSAHLKVNPASVYLIGHRLTQQLKAEVEKLRTQLG